MVEEAAVVAAVTLVLAMFVNKETGVEETEEDMEAEVMAVEVEAMVEAEAMAVEAAMVVEEETLVELGNCIIFIKIFNKDL